MLKNEDLKSVFANDYKQRRYFANKNTTILKINAQGLEKLARDPYANDFVVLSCKFNFLMCNSIISAVNMIRNIPDSDLKKPIYFMDSNDNEVHMQDGMTMVPRPKKFTIGVWFKTKENIVDGKG